MSESARLEEYKLMIGFPDTRKHADQMDEEYAFRIRHLLNHPQIDEYCMVDAYYYDFSEIPEDIQKKHDFWIDVYLIYGITKKGEIVSRWVERWDLDSVDPIINGEVVRSK